MRSPLIRNSRCAMRLDDVTGVMEFLRYRYVVRLDLEAAVRHLSWPGVMKPIRHLDASIKWHYDVYVRTTLTLDPDVARLVDEAAHRARTSRKQVINDALRRELSQPPSRREPYHLPAHEATLQPGFDLAGFNRLADELEDEAILAARKRPGS